MQESLQNFAINALGLAVFGYLVYRDYSQQQKDRQQIAREEALGKLQVCRAPHMALAVAGWESVLTGIAAGQCGFLARQASFYKV